MKKRYWYYLSSKVIDMLLEPVREYELPPRRNLRRLDHEILTLFEIAMSLWRNVSKLKGLTCVDLGCRQPTALYHEKVIEHYESPRNVGSLDKNDDRVGTGIVGAPACGDVMKLQVKVDENGRIIDAKFKTFGCASAIASSSLATEWVKGKMVDEAGAIKNQHIADELKLPPVKLHCSMLAEDAIQAALNDLKAKQKKKAGLK